MATSINIRFKKRDIGSTIFNITFIVIGLIMFYLAALKGPVFYTIGIIFLAIGIYPFSKSKGVLVDKENQLIEPYTAALWIKQKTTLSLKEYESIQVTTGTQVHTRQSITFGQNTAVSFMVYKLHLIPGAYVKTEKIFLGDFFTKKECMMAAEQLSATAKLSLEIKVRK